MILKHNTANTMISIHIKCDLSFQILFHRLFIVMFMYLSITVVEISTKLAINSISIVVGQCSTYSPPLEDTYESVDHT